jgi:hypothetical protein
VIASPMTPNRNGHSSRIRVLRRLGTATRTPLRRDGFRSDEVE